MAALPANFAATSRDSPIDAIVIGAGPAGVVSLRNLLKVNLNAISIERQSAVGGLWIDHTPAYSSLQVLRADWALHGVGCGDKDVDQRRFIRDDVCTWVEEYVETQDIRDRIFLNTEVVHVTPLKPLLFQVDVCSVEKCGYIGGGRRVEESSVRLYARAVLVCAGTFDPTSPLIQVLKTVHISPNSKDRKQRRFLLNIIGIFDLPMISLRKIFSLSEVVHHQWISHKKPR